MGKRILPLLPRLYYNGDGLVPFVELLEPEIEKIEGLTAELTNLIDIDKLPDKYLPYLASKTNTPLMGDDPKLWRLQIRSWPDILKIKGTERSLKMFFRSLGFARYDIKTYWRDANGNYVTEKPAGEPFKGQDGIWYNSRTHYFSVRLWWSTDSGVGTEADSSVLQFIRKWLPRVKPAYAELLEYVSAFMLSEYLDEDLQEILSVGQGPAINENEKAAEDLSPAWSPVIDESLWPRVRYSDPDLYYDGEARYDSQTEGVELLYVGSPTAVSEHEGASESVLSILKIIV